jgi:phosphatidylglycerol:prolipoprotein diacylglycerol transferase
MSQLTDGSLLDMRLEAKPEDGTWVVAQVKAGGRAEQHGIKIGDKVVAVIPPRAEELNLMRSGISAPTASFTLELNDGRRLSWEFRQLPQRSRPVYPVQILASVNALLICGFLWACYPFRRRDGEVSALMITIYPVTRFLLETIRTDEPDVGWTGCSIAQLLSILLVAMAVPLWWLLLKRPTGSALPAATGSPP